MGAVWSALLVGGALAGALFLWLLRGKGKKGDAEEEDGTSGKDAAVGSDRSGGCRLSPGPSRRELVSKPEHLQESNGCLVSESKGPGNIQEAAWGLQSPGERGDCNSSRPHVPSGWCSDTESLTTSVTGYSRGYFEASRNESRESCIGERGFQKGQETTAKAAPCFSEELSPSNLLMDRGKEAVSLTQLDRQDLADPEDWEMVSRHSSWGDIGLSGSLESPALNPDQRMDNGRNTLMEARGQKRDVKTKRVVAMSSESQQVSVRFQVHYITSTGVQFIAVTGDHERLGRWTTYIPLQYSKNGFWSGSVSLPADTVVEWKFVVVENGEITRWEECCNRFLETGHEDKLVHKCWGIH
ncbi:starch-binding domain-containing protein 1 [Molossus molossus]|uniref:Starch-binding domain-containing protein 1 n=1 Tax=Molossus molossus TaxID=27622 RepID=A0A7J8K2P7_MOLMO|nr:starch-binding domain-containing protein 1 [Molossus molossus]KAF6502855.1 starch binding domain 1 [Molossus molossus]